ncbi:MAG: hypothetical protein GXO11_03610 [Epsilonproteobacteria bacterium]|nr:hypothetical protein [Campylobacterota bacterium]
MQINKESFIFFALLVWVVVLLNIHSTILLGVVAVMALMLSYKIFLKALKAVLLFNIGITLGYMIESFLLHHPFLDFIVLFNLRVVDITFFTLYVTSKINIIKALSFSSSLQFLLLATLMQIKSFEKTYEDFVLALKARTKRKLRQKLQKEFISSMFYFFLKKSLHNSKERTLALKARGFFD